MQIAKRRLVTNDVVFVDTTVKSGMQAFAPSWDIVMNHKRGVITDDQYIAVYQSMMRHSYANDRSTWLDLCSHPKVAIGCYCGAKHFCHRHLLAVYLKKVCLANNIPFTYCGEIGVMGVQNEPEDSLQVVKPGYLSWVSTT